MSPAPRDEKRTQRARRVAIVTGETPPGRINVFRSAWFPFVVATLSIDWILREMQLMVDSRLFSSESGFTKIEIKRDVSRCTCQKSLNTQSRGRGSEAGFFSPFELVETVSTFITRSAVRLPLLLIQPLFSCMKHSELPSRKLFIPPPGTL